MKDWIRRKIYKIIKGKVVLVGTKRVKREFEGLVLGQRLKSCHFYEFMKNEDFDYKKYSKHELFGPWFWMHLALNILFLMSPFLFSWKILTVVLILYFLQFAIFKNCLINKVHFNQDKDTVFLYPYLKILGWSLSYQKSKILLRYILPLLLFFIALIWQLVLHHPPFIL